MIIPWLPLIICVLGLLLYALSTNGKVQELGPLAFWVGLLVFLLDFGGRLALH
jgi:hypothetical protein